jgi:hypothetical protein
MRDLEEKSPGDQSPGLSGSQRTVLLTRPLNVALEGENTCVVLKPVKDW